MGRKSIFDTIAHWTGKPNTFVGRVFVDGEEFRFLGDDLGDSVVPKMEVESVDIDMYSTTINCKNNKIKLVAKFTSPTYIKELYYVSRPVGYCRVTVENIDGNNHDIKVRFSCSEELVLASKGVGRAYSRKVNIDGLTTIKMGNGEQNVLNKSGDDICIDWGYLYLSVVGDAEADNECYEDMYAVYCEKEVDKEALFLFAYDDIESMIYFGDRLKAYWKKEGKTIEQAIKEASLDYDEILAKCNAFSKEVNADALKKGGENYAELLTLAHRQVMAAHKLVVDKQGNNLYISKECYSNGCGATVDVTYPSAPMYLLYNPELLKGMLRPIFYYASTPEWKFDFAPHDIGQYPILNDQVHGGNKLESQMPVEECGNMIILMNAICEAENDVSFAKAHIKILSKWNEYLIRYGIDPENQLCTDDFTGHLAHNVNLAIKAIMGIAGYSKILKRLGDDEKSDEMMAVARDYAKSVVEKSKNSDGSYRLAFDKEDTFSLKYNSIWDKIWKTNLFPEEFYQGEIERYKKELLPYGVPLDSREKYTKSDWLLWAACLADNKEDFELLVHSLWSAYNTMRTYAPMPDWYYTDTSHMIIFRNRTVQGGLYIKLMLDYN